MKVCDLSFDAIWQFIKNDDNVSLTAMQAGAVFNFWDSLARAMGKEESKFDPALFCGWKETDNFSDIPASCYIVPYVDLEKKVLYLYSDRRNYKLPF